MDAAPGCRLHRRSSINILTAWPGRLAQAPRVERVLPGPAHHIGAREVSENRTVGGPAIDQLGLDDEVNSQIADRYTVGS